ncbi:MAG: hypothetical protein ABI831_13970 [Betaproteobacteria bacterium]
MTTARQRTVEGSRETVLRGNDDLSRFVDVTEAVAALEHGAAAGERIDPVEFRTQDHLAAGIDEDRFALDLPLLVFGRLCDEVEDGRLRTLLDSGTAGTARPAGSAHERCERSAPDIAIACAAKQSG